MVSTFGPRLGMSDGLTTCVTDEGLQVEMLLGQRLDAVGPVEELPLGLEHGDRVALALGLAP